MTTLAQRWEHVRKDFTLSDLLIDAGGKFLAGLALGALYWRALRHYTWAILILGLALVAGIKLKHWQRFWELK